MREYRVVRENPYTYFIEVKDHWTTGMLWWKKHHSQWATTDVEGNPFGTISYGKTARGKFVPYYPPPLLPFVDKGNAERKIEEFQSIDTLRKVFPKQFVTVA